jgi:murein DD-endopeptidase MepM/ murein hydrolase activator NlpD
MLITAVGAADYIRISRKDLDKQLLEAQLVSQNQELLQYRQQVQKFAREINQIKNRMVELNQIDQQIRRVAQMDERSDLFGIGGSAPEDIDPDLELERQHTQLIVEMHRQVGELSNAAVYQQNSLNDLWKVVEERGNFMAYTPTIRPAEGRISSRFGYRESPFTGQLEFHNGLDIANGWNTEVLATAHGCISFVGETRGFGKLIMIDHGHGVTTRYAHLERILKKRGDMVRRGETIATMGNTGRSTGTHLHYEIRLNGVPVNPQKYFLN